MGNLNLNNGKNLSLDDGGQWKSWRFGRVIEESDEECGLFKMIRITFFFFLMDKLQKEISFVNI